MALVNVAVNGRSYAITCNAGEEEHLLKLAAHVDGKVREILKSAGQPGEQRLLLMAALLIADEYLDSLALLDRRAQEIVELSAARGEAVSGTETTERNASSAIETAAARIEEVAARVAGA